MVGSHALGEAATHPLIPIKDAYKAAVNDSLKDDPVLAAKKIDIERQLLSLDDKLKDINNNFNAVEEKILQVRQLAS